MKYSIPDNFKKIWNLAYPYQNAHNDFRLALVVTSFAKCICENVKGIEGVKLAKEILESINYSANKIEEILEIIAEHDTRVGFISANEGAMRDVDKLWRFTEIGLIRDLENSKYTNTLKKLLSRRIKKLDEDKLFMHHEFSKKLAKKNIRYLETIV